MNAVSYRSGHYNETQLHREFLGPFFEALGWDVFNKLGYAEAYKDVIHEDALKLATASAAPSPRRGRDVEYEVDLTLEEAYHGAGRRLEIDGHRIQAVIPPGVRTGSRVRLAGLGETGQNSGPAGDLYLFINVLPNDSFEREGDDLHIDVPVDIFTAVAGGEIRISTLERPLILKIPPRTNARRSFRLRGKGMPHLGDPNKRGDLYAIVRLVLPDSLTDQEVNITI